MRCQTVVITPWSHCSSISSGGSGVNRVNQHNPAELPFDKTFLLFLSSFYSRKLWASSWHLHTSAVSVNRVPAWVRFVLTDPPSSTRVLMCSWQRADRCFLISIPPTGPWINESAFILPRNISPFSFVCDCLFDVCERRRPRRIDFDSTVFDCGVQKPSPKLAARKDVILNCANSSLNESDTARSAASAPSKKRKKKRKAVEVNCQGDDEHARRCRLLISK